MRLECFRCNEVEKYGVYPWIHQLDNHLTSEHQTQMVRFPDVNPYTLLRPNKLQFTMAAGDFLEVITIVRYVASYNVIDLETISTRNSLTFSDAV